jgi:hypothetical protein
MLVDTSKRVVVHVSRCKSPSRWNTCYDIHMKRLQHSYQMLLEPITHLSCQWQHARKGGTILARLQGKYWEKRLTISQTLHVSLEVSLSEKQPRWSTPVH